MTRLGTPLRDEALRGWRAGGTPVRLAAVVGIVLMAVGLIHGLAFLVVGGTWQGPVAWRKPFAFGLSFGLTTVTVAWVVSCLAVRSAARWALLVPVAAAATVEVGWVSVQRARGVASHFNTASPEDALAFTLAGGGAIAVMVAALVAVAVLTWRRLDAPPPLRSAIRAGLSILLVAQAVGGWMIQRGFDSMALGGPASHAVGAAGDVKLVHAVAMHGIQVLPALALWLLAGTRTIWLARTVVRLAAVGYALLTAATMAQAVTGRAVSDPSPVAAGLAAIALAVLVGTLVVAVVGVLRRRAPSPALAR